MAGNGGQGAGIWDLGSLMKKPASQVFLKSGQIDSTSDTISLYARLLNDCISDASFFHIASPNDP